MKDIKDLPHSMRLFRAIEAYHGGRKAFAKKMGMQPQSLDRWSRERRIAPYRVLEVLKFAGGKVTAEELLGKFDKEKADGN